VTPCLLCIQIDPKEAEKQKEMMDQLTARIEGVENKDLEKKDDDIVDGLLFLRMSKA